MISFLLFSIFFFMCFCVFSIVSMFLHVFSLRINGDKLKQETVPAKAITLTWARSTAFDLFETVYRNSFSIFWLILDLFWLIFWTHFRFFDYFETHFRYVLLNVSYLFVIFQFLRSLKRLYSNNIFQNYIQKKYLKTWFEINRKKWFLTGWDQ